MATLVRWDPVREVAALQNDVGRLFGLLREGNGQTARCWVPALDVWETENDIVYAFDLPGLAEEEISVELEDGALTVSAERKREHEASEDRHYRYERRFGSFSRTIGLPQGVKEEDISADYSNGVLEVHVRKPEETKPRRIEIGTGSKGTIEGKTTKA